MGGNEIFFFQKSRLMAHFIQIAVILSSAFRTVLLLIFQGFERIVTDHIATKCYLIISLTDYRKSIHVAYSEIYEVISGVVRCQVLGFK